MANIKSQKKRALTNAKANLKNRAEKSQLKTTLKKVATAVAANAASSLLDKAASSHLKHKNYVARQKARLAKTIATLG